MMQKAPSRMAQASAECCLNLLGFHLSFVLLPPDLSLALLPLEQKESVDDGADG